MRDTDTVVQMLADEGASLVLEYGSSVGDPADANDVDLFAVYDDGTDRTENVRIGDFEIVRVTKSEFRGYRRVLDPVYCTEPVLKGQVRHGSRPTFQEIRADLVERDSTDDAVRHNLRRSHEEYVKATDFVEQGDTERAGRTLPFAVSHRLFAKWYANGNCPATLNRVREEIDTELPSSEIFATIERMKAGESATGDVEDLLAAWKESVLQL
jgi:hypothetical protein